MAYCTVDDVASAFPAFKRNASGSITDAQIQGWIDDRKARIRSTFLARGIDPDALTLTADQTSFLRGLNRDGAIADVGDALQAGLTLQPGEYSLADAHRKSFERTLDEIKRSIHDRLFSTLAKTTEIKPAFGGTAGADTLQGQTPEDRDENRSFGKNQVF